MQSGIYRIYSDKDKRCYIGKSKHIELRLIEHFNKLNKNIHHSIKLQRFVNKYGCNILKTEVILLVKYDNEVDLVKLEKYYIKKYDSFNNGFNMTIGGEFGDTWKMMDNNSKIRRKKNIGIAIKNRWERLSITEKDKLIKKMTKNRIDTINKWTESQKQIFANKQHNLMLGNTNRLGKSKFHLYKEHIIKMKRAGYTWQAITNSLIELTGLEFKPNSLSVYYNRFWRLI